MQNDDNDRMPIAWGDVSAIVIMAGVGIFTLWLIGDMLLGGHPLGVLVGTGQQQTVVAPPPTAAEIRNTQLRLEPGEERLFLPEKPKTPPAKPKTQGTAETPR